MELFSFADTVGEGRDLSEVAGTEPCFARVPVHLGAGEAIVAALGSTRLVRPGEDVTEGEGADPEAPPFLRAEQTLSVKKF